MNICNGSAYSARRSLVRRFIRDGIERQDLEQVAALGYVKAQQRYEAARGVPFHQYAWYAVCGELLHYVRDHERMVRMPRNLWELSRREPAADEHLTHTLGRTAKAEEIATLLGASTEDIRLVRQASTYSPIIAEPISHTRHDVLEQVIIRDALAMLSREEHTMVVGVYFCGYSQSEVGERLGYAQRRASRLHARALRRLAAVIGEKSL